jgi:hypothetical protein
MGKEESVFFGSKIENTDNNIISFPNGLRQITSAGRVL